MDHSAIGQPLLILKIVNNYSIPTSVFCFEFAQILLFLISQDPFDCDCHLAWLIRDNRELLPYLDDTGTCSNGTTFEDLDPNGFADCAVCNLNPTLA